MQFVAPVLSPPWYINTNQNIPLFLRVLNAARRVPGTRRETVTICLKF